MYKTNPTFIVGGGFAGGGGGGGGGGEDDKISFFVFFLSSSDDARLNGADDIGGAQLREQGHITSSRCLVTHSV
jgi:hypothetical protein